MDSRIEAYLSIPNNSFDVDLAFVRSWVQQAFEPSIGSTQTLIHKRMEEENLKMTITRSNRGASQVFDSYRVVIKDERGSLSLSLSISHSISLLLSLAFSLKDVQEGNWRLVGCFPLICYGLGLHISLIYSHISDKGQECPSLNEGLTTLAFYARWCLSIRSVHG